MEIAKNGIASSSIRDLPPSKPFKFINSDPTSTPCLPLPAKKRMFAPPPAAAVPLCLPANKRAILLPPSEDAIPVCLPAKKRAYASPVNAVATPTCLPAKKRPYALPPPPDSVAWPCVPTKKRVHAPPPREISAGSAPVRLPVKSRVDGRPPRKDAAGTILVCPPAKNRVHERPPQKQEAEEEQDDGVLCAVCRSTDGDPSDPIVFCDGCDLMVHASCYGNPLAQAIPDGDWFCSLCSTNKSKAMEAVARPRCCLCPANGGAMKRTTEGQWAHIACALLVPEVFFRDPDGRDGVDCSRVPAHRFTKECYICETSNGCALECSQPKCGRRFHVSCGLDGGLCIEYQEGKSGAIVAGFCREHTELWEKQQLTGKYKIVARGQE